ncbi:response regulator FixJ [Sphingosinicella sp.]|jgi:two-component system response regulator FixJ|uniref:response regulator FixJ n=1 Tax=Sphingosinicella sp. TaxID=1917971 RepID=UPI0017CF53B2|nr:response regulator FixJ [Sphingosinicella sp.]MBA4759027.1 response regulator [Sphingosinicella sp.]
MADDPTVHVIDDDEGVRASLAFLLDCSGIATQTHDSAADFLRGVPTMRHGCIITDVRMPGMSGIDLLARLETLGVTDPVIVITGHADVPMAIQALRAGVSDFIEKPFSDEAILVAVRSALAKYQGRGEAETERAEIVKRLATLSGREREVMDGLVEGKANKVIAFDLDISARTVEVYRANAMTKMGARTLSELVRMVMIARLA